MKNKNIQKQKCMLGILMSLVLALGVQGGVNAQSVFMTGGPNSAPIDDNGNNGVPVIYSMKDNGQENLSFTFQVLDAKDGTTITIAGDNWYAVNRWEWYPDRNKKANPVIDAISVPAAATNEAGSPSISTSGNPSISKGVITFDAPGAAGSENANWKWSGSITVNYHTAGYGRAKVTVKDNETADRGADDFQIQHYVVQSPSNARLKNYQFPHGDRHTTATPHVSSGSDLPFKVRVWDGDKIQNWVQVDLSITNGKLYLKPSTDPKHYDLYLSGGKLYPRATQHEGFTNLSVFTHYYSISNTDIVRGAISPVSVVPDSGATPQVTATLPGALNTLLPRGLAATRTVIYFTDGIVMQEVSGNHQAKRAGEILDAPLVVRVLDGNRPVPNQRVRFTAEGDATAKTTKLRATIPSLFLPELAIIVSKGSSNERTVQTASVENTAEVSVYTDAEGYAKVDVTLPATPGKYKINAHIAEHPHDWRSNFKSLKWLSVDGFSVYATRDPSSVYIDAAHSNTTPATVRYDDSNQQTISVQVAERGNTFTAAPHTEVAFSIEGGRLSLPGSSQQTRSLTVSTDSTGVARASVSVGKGIARVTAHLPGSTTADGTHVVTFLSNTAAIKSTIERVSGNYQHNRVGERLNAPLVVRVSDAKGMPVGRGETVRFTAPAGVRLGSTSPSRFIQETGSAEQSRAISIRTNARGEAEVYVYLPNTAGQYTITAYPVTLFPVENSPSAAFEVFAARDPSRDLHIYAPYVNTTPTLVEYARSDSQSISVQVAQGSVNSHVQAEQAKLGIQIAALLAGGLMNQDIPVGDLSGLQWAPYTEVEFSVEGGMLYVDPELLDQRQPVYSHQLRVCADGQGVARASVSVSKRIAKVTARIPGGSRDGGRYVVTYISGGIQLEKVSGGAPYAAGAPGTLRPDPFVVQVLAGGSPLANQIVKFTVAPESGEPVPREVCPALGTTVFVTRSGRFTIDDSAGFWPAPNSVPEPVQVGCDYTVSGPIFVRTDAKGLAKVSLRMGSMPTEHVVKAEMYKDGNNPWVEFRVHPLIGQAQSRQLYMALLGNDDQQRTVRVYARDPNGRPQAAQQVRLSGGRILQPTVTTGPNGVAETTLTLPDTGHVQVTAEAEGYVPASRGVTIDAPPTTRPTERTPTEPTPVNLELVSGNDQSGPVGTQLAADFVVRVVDSNDQPVAGQTVTFAVMAGGGSLSTTSTTSNANGAARTRLSLGSTPGTNRVEASVSGLPVVTFITTATAGAERIVDGSRDTPTDGSVAQLVSVDGDGQTGSVGTQLASDFVVSVLDGNGDGVVNHSVTFTVTEGGGFLSVTYATTDANGEARTRLTLGSALGTNRVQASVRGLPPVIFTATAGAQGDSAKLYLAVSGSGEMRTVTVYAYGRDGQLASNVDISLSGGSFSRTVVRTGDDGAAESLLVLPKSGTVTVTATAEGYESAATRITVGARADRLTLVSGNDQKGPVGTPLSSDFVVRVENENNQPVQNQTVAFAITAGGGSLSVISETTDVNGEARTRLTLGGAPGINRVQASASGLSVVTFTATATAVATNIKAHAGDNQTGAPNQRLAEPFVIRVTDANGLGVPTLIPFKVTQGKGQISAYVETDAEGWGKTYLTPYSTGTIKVEARLGDLSATFTATAGKPPDALVAISGNKQHGIPGSQLANPFIVQVLDADDSPIEGISVTFSVTAGGGSLSLTEATTATNGQAQTYLTLGETRGENIVAASVSGVAERITFRATSAPRVEIAAAERPPMYWIDTTQGTLHRLVSEKVEDLAPNVTGISSFAVDPTHGKLYFAAENGKKRATLHRANLNGTDVKTLAEIFGVPLDLEVDGGAGKLYWIDEVNRLQTADLNAKNIRNVLRDLPTPKHLALDVAARKLYWTEADGRIQRANFNGESIETVATNLGTPLALDVGGRKVFWIDQAGNTPSKLRRSNLNGANLQTLRTLPSAPDSIGVDAAARHLYLTQGSNGKINRRNFNGSGHTPVIIGLTSPGEIVLVAPKAEADPATQQTPPTTYVKYDVNKDGKVDNTDLTIVTAALGQNPPKDPRTDINKDGTVDKDDLVLVAANFDADAAAPALGTQIAVLGRDYISAQIDLLLVSNDTSLEAQRILAYLQNLLAAARPDKTLLLANYPNPFNPETWIPYQLAEASDVTITIYDMKGTVVRTLRIGHQSGGYYTARSRAAYWDGRNASGERVASGIYFYQLHADEISPLRKMVILK